MNKHTEKAQRDRKLTPSTTTQPADNVVSPDLTAWTSLRENGSQANAPIDPNAFNPRMVLQLQRTIGNRAVNRLVNSGADTSLAQRQAAPEIQREVDPETSEWAATTNTSVEQIQDAVSAALGRLNTDASAAIGHIRDAQTQYDNFDEMYNNAVARFVGGVEAAQAKEKEFRDNVKFVATTVFALAAPQANAVYGALDGALSKVQSVTALMMAVTTPAAPASTSGGTSPGMSARRGENRVNWSELLTTTLTAFENTVRNNAALKGRSDDCVRIVRFLNQIQTGRYTGDDPRADPLAAQADQMVSNLTSIIAQLGEIDEGIVSGSTETLKNQIIERVGSVTSRSLEQDIAIRWMAGLDNNDLDQIDTADAYLAQLGVFDQGDNRLDYDTGNITTDIDERVLHWRAEWETIAMGLVGSTATWLGNPLVPNTPIDDGERCLVPRAYGGQVRDNRNREWNVSVPGGVTPEGGGELLIVGYRFDRMDSSNWEWSYPGDLQRQLQWEITLQGQPAGPMGGGAPEAGPIIHAPD